MWGALSTLLVSTVGFCAPDPWQMNMYRGVTPIEQDTYNLHMIAIGVCAVIGIIVFGIMIYSLIYHRRSRGYEAAPFHENLKVEIIWTIIPFLILVALAVPATSVLIRMEDTSDSDITIKVVGSQWKWQYQYLDQGISFFSNLSTPRAQIMNEEAKGPWYLLEVDRPLVIPVHKKIRFLVTSTDVIHSWWVPELGVKRDAIPGFMYEAWAKVDRPGTYRGQCTELCGINHGFMPIVVQALSEEDFNQWVAAQPKAVDMYAANPAASAALQPMTKDALMTLGKKKYEMFCAACHRNEGQGMPPMFPALKGSSVAVGKPISRHINIVLQGVPNTAMQGYKDQLTDQDLAAIITYERNAWGNNTNDLVQPTDVAQVRQENTASPTMVNKAQSGGMR
ncbi:MAG: cytochrome c oxidase subunit II [Legionellaceae bacterium]|nr:cytochrome c oxidase subunit II [Legionellaceae bacterium]